MQKRKYILVTATVLSAVLLACTVTILPLIIRNQTVSALREASGRRVSIDSVAVNPFSLTVTLNGLTIGSVVAGTPPLLAISSVRASLSSASLFKRALVLDELAIVDLSLAVTRQAPHRFNFDDIAEHLNAQPKKASTGEARYSLHNITVHNASIDFDDQAVDSGRKHTVRKLDVAIPFISNIPHLVETYTQPSISAVINGAPFSFSGQVKPFSKSLESSIHINVKKIDLPRYIAYLPVKLPVTIAAGSLTLDAQVLYRVSADKRPELTIKGSGSLDELLVNERNGQPLVRIPSLNVTASNLDVFAHRFDFDSIVLERAAAYISRDSKGAWSYSQFVSAPPAAGAVPAAKNGLTTTPARPETTTRPGSSVSVASLTIADSTVHFSDATPVGGFSTTISDINVTAQRLSTTAAVPAAYKLSLQLEQNATVAAHGNCSFAPTLAATSSLTIHGLSLRYGWPYLASYLPYPLNGRLDVSGDMGYNEPAGLTVDNGNITLSALSSRAGNKDSFDLASLAVNGASYHHKERRAEIGEIRLSKGTISLSREENGAMPLLASRASKPDDSPQTAARPPLPPQLSAQASDIPATTVTGKPAVPFSWSLKRLQLEQINGTFIDKTRSAHPRFTLKNAGLLLTNLGGPQSLPTGLKFSAIFNHTTRLAADGELTPSALRYKGNLSLGGLRLRDFEDYIPDTINVFLVNGTIDSAMNVDLALQDGKPAGTFKGSGGVRSFHCVDTVAEEELLGWESLQLDTIQGTLSPFSLAIREVALNNFYSRIVILNDGRLSLQNLLQKPESMPAAPLPARPDGQERVLSPPGINKKTAGRPSISIGAVTLQEGTIAFTDRHMAQTFNSTFYNLGGRISGLSSETTKMADVDLRGNLENHSPLQITGTINPLREDLFVDLKVSFKDIDLSPVTPYSGTYLGYTVEKGKLFLDLKYFIDRKQLNSENKVFIDQFTFGTKVDSPKATALPVRLAVALLKDRNGEIHLDVPVSGRTDDPRFNVWAIAWQAFKNLIVKAATSPFALLSSLAGGSHDFSDVQFSSGSSSLSEQNERKLSALARLLADRPELKMEVKGYVDREPDAEGFRRELLERKLRTEKFLQLARDRQLKEGETADLMQIMPDERSRFLKAVYLKEKFPKPRNAIGLVKDLSDDEMYKLIIAYTVIGETELQTLAHERVLAVTNYLVNKGGLDAGRLFQKNDDIHKRPEKDTAGQPRVEFNAIAR